MWKFSETVHKWRGWFLRCVLYSHTVSKSNADSDPPQLTVPGQSVSWRDLSCTIWCPACVWSCRHQISSRCFIIQDVSSPVHNSLFHFSHTQIMVCVRVCVCVHCPPYGPCCFRLIGLILQESNSNKQDTVAGQEETWKTELLRAVKNKIAEF